MEECFYVPTMLGASATCVFLKQYAMAQSRLAWGQPDCGYVYAAGTHHGWQTCTEP